MPVDQYLFLLVGMLDNTSPEVTEPPEEKIARLTREAHQRAMQRARGRRW